jgi:hypothetical protein
MVAAMWQRIHGGPMRTASAVLLLVLAAAIAGCGSSSNSGSASTSAASGTSSAASGGVNPNAPETLPPGDIPDTIAYVRYAWPGHQLSLTTPEGWSRTNSAGTLVFTDKLNTIRVQDTPKGQISVASAQRDEVPTIAAATKGFKLQSVTTVARPAGPAIRVAYLGYSQPDPVTGKFGVLAFERYYFVHNGRKVVLTLSAPNGSDNVDPWRKVTSSLRFTG